MTLLSLLEGRRTAIVDRWLELVLRVYPEDTARFMTNEMDRFGNPVGKVTRESLEGLLAALLAGRSSDEMKEALDGIVRIRAVQDLPPSKAVGFVFLLKRAIRELLDEHGSDGAAATELTSLHDAIDRTGLAAFDRYVQCREKIYDLRAHEIRRRTASLLKRLEGPAGAEEGPPRG